MAGLTRLELRSIMEAMVYWFSRCLVDSRTLVFAPESSDQAEMPDKPRPAGFGWPDKMVGFRAVLYLEGLIIGYYYMMMEMYARLQSAPCTSSIAAAAAVDQPGFCVCVSAGHLAAL
jgi:hypothetical protein